jgi:transposase InsO family protein
LLGITNSKYYSWVQRKGEANNHNGKMPKKNWILNSEKEAIIKYAKKHENEGYRRLTYMMLDENIAAVSPTSTYRILFNAGLLNKWNKVSSNKKGSGFDQPEKIHQDWHIDIKYVNYKGTFLFLISIIDGYSRYIIHHELRCNMQESDVEITIQRALEKFPGYRPRIISDNGTQFVSRDFRDYLSFVELKHIRTSVAYPQSNGKIERFHRTISEEHLRKISMIDIDDARKQLNNYIDHYNNIRLHSALFYLTPNDFLNKRIDQKIKEREIKLNNARKNRYLKNMAAFN